MKREKKEKNISESVNYDFPNPAFDDVAELVGCDEFTLMPDRGADWYAGGEGWTNLYHECSDRSDVLMQAAIVFKELDELSFLVAFAAALVFLYFCVVLECRRWCKMRNQEKDLSG